MFFMTVTLEIKPEIKDRAEAKAKSLGKALETFLIEVIEENINGDLEEKPFYETASNEEWIAELNSLSEFSDKISQKWDDSRESIYGEREANQI
jgi:predicted DNA-binding protein